MGGSTRQLGLDGETLVTAAACAPLQYWITERKADGSFRTQNYLVDHPKKIYCAIYIPVTGTWKLQDGRLEKSSSSSRSYAGPFVWKEGKLQDLIHTSRVSDDDILLLRTEEPAPAYAPQLPKDYRELSEGEFLKQEAPAKEGQPGRADKDPSARLTKEKLIGIWKDSQGTLEHDGQIIWDCCYSICEYKADGSIHSQIFHVDQKRKIYCRWGVPVTGTWEIKDGKLQGSDIYGQGTGGPIYWQDGKLRAELPATTGIGFDEGETTCFLVMERIPEFKPQLPKDYREVGLEEFEYRNEKEPGQ